MGRLHKNEDEALPSHGDPDRFELIFRHIRDRDTEQSSRVERILELICSLGEDLNVREKARVIAQGYSALARYRWASRVSHTLEGFREVRYPAERESLSEEEEMGIRRSARFAGRGALSW